MDRLLGKDEVCEYLGISPRTLSRIIDRRELSVIRVGAGVRFYESDLQAYIDSQRVEARPPIARINTPPAPRKNGRPRAVVCGYEPGMKVV